MTKNVELFDVGRWESWEVEAFIIIQNILKFRVWSKVRCCFYLRLKNIEKRVKINNLMNTTKLIKINLNFCFLLAEQPLKKAVYSCVVNVSFFKASAPERQSVGLSRVSDEESASTSFSR